MALEKEVRVNLCSIMFKYVQILAGASGPFGKDRKVTRSQGRVGQCREVWPLLAADLRRKVPIGS